MKMNKAMAFVFAGVALLGTSNLLAGDRSKCGDLQYENIYKHFVGTIGKDTVVLDLRWGYCGGSNNGGSFFYSTSGKDFRYLMIGEPESYAHDVLLTAHEYKIEDNWFLQSRDEVPSWDFIIKGNTLTGKWHSADKKLELEIKMTEDYRNATPLEIMTYGEETKEEKAFYSKGVNYSFIGVKPTADVKKPEADFISNNMLQLANGNSVNAAKWTDYPKLQAVKDINEYKAKPQPKDANGYSGYHKTYCHHGMFPMYNENGILVAEYMYSSDDKSGHSFSNIDVANKKILTSADIFLADKATLTRLLRDEYHNIKSPDGSEQQPVENIVPTDNLVITHNGIAFNYPRGSNCSTEIWVFLSYDQLKGVLTKDFKDKMKI